MARPTLYRHPKFINLQISLETIPPHALGYLTMVWEAGWESGNPVIGGEAVIERLACWPGEPGKLCRALLSASGEPGKPGFIVEVEGRPGIYAIHDFWDHAPEYVKDRKRKEDSRKNGKNRVQSGGSPKMSDLVPDKIGQIPEMSGRSPKKSDTPTPAPAPAPAPSQNTCVLPSAEEPFDELKLQAEAHKIAKAYAERLRSPHGNGGCIDAIWSILNAQVASPSILYAAIEGYAKKFGDKTKDRKFVKAGKTFFGDGTWEEYRNGAAKTPEEIAKEEEDRELEVEVARVKEQLRKEREDAIADFERRENAAKLAASGAGPTRGNVAVSGVDSGPSRNGVR